MVSRSFSFSICKKALIMVATPPGYLEDSCMGLHRVLGTDNAQSGNCTLLSQEEVHWGTQVSSCLLGQEGCQRLGISLTTHTQNGVGPCSSTSTHSCDLPVPSRSSCLTCKILPYMELKTASQCPTEPPPQPGAACRDSREVPSSPFCPPPTLTTSGCQPHWPAVV